MVVEQTERWRGFGAGAGETAVKFVVFGLGSETYGLPVLQVQEVIRDFELTTLPHLPAAFLGVINLRGEAVPVVSLRRRFELPDHQQDDKTRVIVIESEPNPIGVQVDEVQRVTAVGPDEFEAAPELPLDARTQFISGLARLGSSKFTILLDMQQILSSVERFPATRIGALVRERLSRQEEQVSSEEEDGDGDDRPSTEQRLEKGDCDE